MIVGPGCSFHRDGTCNVYYLFAAENTDDAGISSQQDSSRHRRSRPAISGLFGYGLRPFRERVLRILNGRESSLPPYLLVVSVLSCVHS